MQQRFLSGLQSPNQAFGNSSLNQSSLQPQQHAQAVYQAQNNNNNNTSLSGPPINSLFDNLRNDKSFQTPTKNFYQQNQIVHQDTPQISNNNNTSGFNQSRIFSPIPYGINNNDFNNSYQVAAPNQSFSINPNYNNRFNQSDFWVTIFGFPTEAVSIILSHFSGCGTILEKVCSSGNWIHLRFSSRGECEKALLYNGKIIGNSLMIGVTRCQDEAVLEKENSIDCSRASVNKIRSLTQAAFKSAKMDHEVVPSIDDPKKSTGIVNKAMDLLFGW